LGNSLGPNDALAEFDATRLGHHEAALFMVDTRANVWKGRQGIIRWRSGFRPRRAVLAGRSELMLDANFIRFEVCPVISLNNGTQSGLKVIRGSGQCRVKVVKFQGGQSRLLDLKFATGHVASNDD
jgi:hypothetical protein